MSASTTSEDDHSAAGEDVPDDSSVGSTVEEPKASTISARKVVESLGSRCSRCTVMSLVLLVAAVAGTSAYFYTSENEQDSFEARVST